MRSVLTLLLAALSVCAQSAMPEARAALALEGGFSTDADKDEANYIAMLGRELYFAAAAGNKSLNPSARAIVDPLTQAVNAANWNQAWRLGTRFAVFARGGVWNDALEAASSYDFRADRRWLAPGETLHLTALPLFSLGRPLRRPVTIEMGWRGQPLRSFSVDTLQEIEMNLSTAALRPGAHAAQFRLLDGQELLSAVEREVFVEAGWVARVEALKKSVAALDANPLSPSQKLALHSADYVAQAFARARAGYAGAFEDTLHPMTVRVRGGASAVSGPLLHWEADLAQAERYARELAAGADPLRNARGRFRLAVRSSGALVPFRLQIPETGDGPFPVILALHGAAGDENSFFDHYRVAGEPALPAAASRYAIVAPASLGAYSLFQGTGEASVRDALSAAQSLPLVQKSPPFLLGYSMGAFGALTLASKTPEAFRAAAVVAGLADPGKVDLTRAAKLPLRLFTGGVDHVVVPAEVQRFSVIAKHQFSDFQAIAIPAADHASAFTSALPAVLEFFDAIVTPPQRP